MAMRVRMRTTYAGPAGTARAGQTIELEDEQAAALLSAGYAEEVVEPAAEASGAADATPADETATIDQPETTSTRTRRPTPKGGGRRSAPPASASGTSDPEEE